MIRLSLIGIGTGNPEHLTLQAIRVLQEADRVLIPEKGRGKEDLADLRRAICADHAPDVPLAVFEMPRRDPAITDYAERVEAWHDAIARLWQEALAPLGQEGHAALLVWGDPSLYDSTLRIAGRVARDLPMWVEVVPGITAIQAMTAAHAIPLNTLGGTVAILPARRLRDHGWPEGAETIVVMLDEGTSFETLPDDTQVWWTAYAGMAEEISIAGRLKDALPRIRAARVEARAAHGWIMDTTLLRRGDAGA
ncbi:precorrin-6A synthase (deacetylating) [Pseudaestuariivita atlantica]|uniref:Precorrin-6A synthase [deacetylating] n=1 Tax=Pseudaestuariivita atlantica TaxID=1317121 RepID=A0A0L1JQP4_9RHOB|nr:precorrin-6A synthase (deacetylating) [Pseudaestuariivita atlantica]KNG94032.1 precorrin 6A synthase [Pseudaestuariivita atlantica]